MSEFELALRGWRQTTAKIFYFCPDFPVLLNPHWLLWQNLDAAPRFPRLNDYLRWWNDTLDGKVHSVHVSVSGLIAPVELQYRDGEFKLQ